MKSILRKLIVAGALFGIAAAAGGYAFLRIDPVGFRSVIFQPVREVTYFVRELDVLHGWSDIERVEIPAAGTVVIPATEDSDRSPVTITAGVYRPATEGPAPALIIQHGSYPWGRKAGLVRLLGARLAAAGFLVIAPDARGFGDTTDPVDPDDPESWRTAADLNRVIDFLLEKEDADPANIFVLGHSMGANHALEGGLENPRVRALILVGPGRFTRAEDVQVPEWVRARFAADRRLEEPVPVDVARFAYSLGNIRLLAETRLAAGDHQPILLIDGEMEGAAKLAYLDSIVATLPGPIEYHTLPGTGHYCGVRSFYGSETVYFRPDMFEPFWAILIEFLERQRSATGVASPLSRVPLRRLITAS